MNVPAQIGMAVSSRYATAAELSTVLSLEDLFDVLEIMTIDGHNRRIREKDRG